MQRLMVTQPFQRTKAMTKLTTSAIAAAILAVMAGAAHAQATGPGRQIQVLPAPGQEQIAQAPQAVQAPATDGAAAQPEQAEPQAQAPQVPAPKAGPEEGRPAPKFAPVPPKFVAPKRPAYAEGYGHESYGYSSYGYAPKRHRSHCH
jgi:hypothetical protein